MKLPIIAVLAWALGAESFGQEVQDPQSSSVSGAELRFAKASAFLTKIRFADPDYRLILIACLKENELNLLLSRHVTPQEIPVLVKGLLGQLRDSFPGQSLSVVAFRPVVPLREAGIARLNPETGEISYWDGAAATRSP